MVPEWSGLAEVEVNTSSFGVYQCFAGNEFGYSVIAIRITVDGEYLPFILSWDL